MTKPIVMSGRSVAEFLYQRRFRISSEKILQDDVEKAFVRADIPYEREKSLSPGDRVDFLVDGRIALELKIKGRAARHMAQIERYAKHACVDSIVLLTNVPVGHVPTMHEKKPCFVVSLGRQAF